MLCMDKLFAVTDGIIGLTMGERQVLNSRPSGRINIFCIYASSFYFNLIREWDCLNK